MKVLDLIVLKNKNNKQFTIPLPKKKIKNLLKKIKNPKSVRIKIMGFD